MSAAWWLGVGRSGFRRWRVSALRDERWSPEVYKDRQWLASCCGNWVRRCSIAWSYETVRRIRRLFAVHCSLFTYVPRELPLPHAEGKAWERNMQPYKPANLAALQTFRRLWTGAAKCERMKPLYSARSVIRHEHSRNRYRRDQDHCRRGR